MLTFFTCITCIQSVKSYAIVSSFSAALWLVMWIASSLLGRLLDEKFTWTGAPWKRLLIGVVSSVVFSVVSVYLVLSAWEAMFNFDFGGFKGIITTSLIITFVVSLVRYSYVFLISWKESLLSAEKFKRESIAARYESLKSQVNPHFLFNSLNALTNLVYEDPDKAAKFIKQLSQVYRYVLDTREKEVVPLEEELLFLKSYFYLQEIRFGGNLKIQMDLDAARGQVAPLALQLLVENAIKHNVVSSADPLRLRLYEEAGFIVVENTLQKKMVLGEDSSGMGLENIRQRYSFLSSQPVLITDNDGTFKVKLPLIEPEEL